MLISYIKYVNIFYNNVIKMYLYDNTSDIVGRHNERNQDNA